MNRNAILALTLAAAVGAFFAWPGGKVVAVGAQAPDFRLASLAGGTASLSSYKGKLVLLNFWATWCPECLKEFPALDALHQKYAKHGFVVVAPSVDAEGRKAVMPFVARMSPSFTVLLSDPKTAELYGVRGLPTSFLIGPDGRIEERYLGAIDPAQLENDILKKLPSRSVSR